MKKYLSPLAIIFFLSFVALADFFVSSGCTPMPVKQTAIPVEPVKVVTPPPATVAVPAPVKVITLPVSRVTLSWENTTAAHPERAAWSDELMKLVKDNKALFDQAGDLSSFCPKYKTLKEEDQIKAIAELVVGVIYYESGFSPVSRMEETTMGTDPVTKLHVFSEGLLQLSYQDKRWAPYCRFDWEADKKIAATDPKRTILDPIVNLDCGVVIMAKQAAKQKNLAVQKGNYWAVLKPASKHGTVDKIAARVQKYVSVCN